MRGTALDMTGQRDVDIPGESTKHIISLGIDLFMVLFSCCLVIVYTWSI